MDLRQVLSKIDTTPFYLLAPLFPCFDFFRVEAFFPAVLCNIRLRHAGRFDHDQEFILRSPFVTL